MAAVVRSPLVPQRRIGRRRWPRREGSGWTGWAGRFEKAHRGAGPDRAGQADGVGIGGRRRRAAERSAEEFATIASE